MTATTKTTIEQKKVLILLYKIIKRVKTTEIIEQLKELRKEDRNEKEILIKANLEIKEMFGINLTQAKFILEKRLPTEISPSLTKFIPAYENLKTVLSGVFFYQPHELSEVGIYEVKRQLTNSLISFGYNLVTAKIYIDELRPN